MLSIILIVPPLTAEPLDFIFGGESNSPYTSTPPEILIQNQPEKAWILTSSGGDFHVYLANSSDKKTHIGWYLKEGIDPQSVDLTDKVLSECNGTPILDDKDKAITLKYETNKVPNSNEPDGFSNGYYLALTDAKAVNIDSCISLNPVVVYEDIKVVSFETDGTSINASLQQLYNEEWTIHNNYTVGFDHLNWFFYGNRYDNETSWEQWKWTWKSNVPIKKLNNFYYFIDNNKGYKLNTNKICNAILTNGTYWDFNEQMFLPNIVDNANCSYQFWTTDKEICTNETGCSNVTDKYFMSVTFRGSDLDPTYSFEYIDSQLITDNVTFQSTTTNNYTHLNIGTQPPYNNLVGYWSFDIDVNNTEGTTAYDLVDNNDGTYTGNAVTNTTDCPFDSCVKFDGSGDYVNFGTSTTLKPMSHNFTASYWVQGITTSLDCPIGDKPTGALGVEGWYIRYQVAATLDICVADGTNYRCKDYNYGGLTDGDWHLTTFVWDGLNDNISLYIDGVLQADKGTNNFGTVGEVSSSSSLNIGRRGNGQDFTGSIDEVMIFNRSLNQTEVTDIFNNQSARFVNEGTQTHKNINITSNYNTVTVDINSTQLKTEFDTNVSARVGYWNVSKGYNETDFNELNSLVSYWHCDADQAVDAIGLNNGTLNGNIINNTGVFNNSYYLDGAADYIQALDHPSLTFGNLSNDTNYTIHMWVYPRSFSGTPGLYSKAISASVGEYYLVLGGAGEIYARNIDNSAGGYMGAYTANGLTLNEWNHLVITYNGTADYTGFGIYVDSIAKTTSDTSGGGAYVAMEDTSRNFIIGSRGASNYFNGSFDEFMIFNRSLTPDEVKELYVKGRVLWDYSDYQELSTEITIDSSTNILPQLKLESNLYQFYTPYTVDNIEINLSQLSLGDVTPPSIDIPAIFALNSTQGVLGQIPYYNTDNLTAIEYTRLNFTVSDDTNISGDISIYYTANGTGSCAPGNKQNNICYNLTNNNWIKFKNGTETESFKDEGNTGDFIDCSITGHDQERYYTCDIDEHYNPNVFKWYSAGYNFSDVKWQTGSNERITQDNVIKIEVNGTHIPIDADQYKLDFRVNYTTGPLLPQQPLEAYLCNSTYPFEAPSSVPECALVSSLLPSQFSGDGTKYRAIFTKELIDTIGDIKYVILDTPEANPSRYYSLKTYKALTPAWTQKWEYSTSGGDTYSPNADGYETELNINWFYNGADPTGISFKIEAVDTLGNRANTSIFNIVWDIDASQNYAPLLSIITPGINESVNSESYSITWEVNEPNNDNYTTSINISNATDTTELAVNLSSSIESLVFNSSEYSDGGYNITITTCENETVDLFCSQDIHQFNIVSTILNTIYLGWTDISFNNDLPSIYCFEFIEGNKCFNAGGWI